MMVSIVVFFPTLLNVVRLPPRLRYFPVQVDCVVYVNQQCLAQSDEVGVRLLIQQLFVHLFVLFHLEVFKF